MDRFWREMPGEFEAVFKGEIDRLQTWQALRQYVEPIALAAQFQRAEDPAYAAARAKLEKEAKDKVSDYSPAKITAALGISWPLTPGPLARAWGSEPAPPIDPIAAGALQAEYAALFTRRYVDVADPEKAHSQTIERLGTKWGPSVVNGGALMKYPPERFYPQVDGSHDWMKRDVEATIVASRGGEAEDPRHPDVLFGKAFSYKLLSDQHTHADVAAKRAPSYVVMVTDSTGRPTIPLDWSGNPMRFSFDPANAQETARERFTTARERRAAAPDNLAMPVP
jgi:hypothetical protein